MKKRALNLFFFNLAIQDLPCGMRAKPSVTGTRDFIRNTITYRYIDPSHHYFENCLLPWFSPPLKNWYIGIRVINKKHYLLCLTEQSFQGNVPLIIQNEKTPKFISWMKICHQLKMVDWGPKSYQCWPCIFQPF